MARSTMPRTRAGMNSLMALFIALYSPPACRPQREKKKVRSLLLLAARERSDRTDAKAGKEIANEEAVVVPRKGGGEAGAQDDGRRHHEELLSSVLVCAQRNRNKLLSRASAEAFGSGKE